uniref:NADH-ubiquinone oxidoreductase chain 4 n=1 Tax=Hydatigera krepkogorski TaxID=1434709 RepID=N0DLG7_9CEST|nr:NADH dehydrogenase subunit 4 [Hydatigera krepkogorski]BAN15681.1 NADH dehydrogenase subunit 4 [Hydatigera krepkogorski]
MFIFVSLSSFIVFISLLLSLLMFSYGINCFSLLQMVAFSNLFIFDSISFYLLMLVLILGVYSQILFFNLLSFEVRLYLFSSLIFTVLSFCVNHSILFWISYELSMFPLLYLIFSESPYSERFLAGWYFSGYLISTSLPLVLILLYLSFLNDSFFFSDWHIVGSSYYMVYYLVSFIFFTKVPLVPFHTWLPIVHAEATSIVSIFLSGYIMKLGLLGVYRCSWFIFDYQLLGYLVLCCLTCIGFLIVACTELDGKRWLAFLSLAHIVVPFIGFYISDWSSINYVFFYCLGHGLSAGIVFGLLWLFYDLCNTRNWILLKSGINGIGFMLIVVVSMLSLCSFPTTIQFFSEVKLVTQSASLIVYLLFWALYLFFGGLVPLILCGHLLVRSEWYENSSVGFSYLYFLVFLNVWCYLSFLVF